MKNIFCSVILFLFLIISSTETFASDYSIPTIRIDVAVLENGTVSITEHLTYNFDGSFSWADHRFPKQGFSKITNIQVFEGDTLYINSNSEDEGTFSVNESDKHIIIKWHYSANDTTRTFSISYELEGTLVVGEEWTEFFWNYLASGRNKSTNDLNINISLPETVSSDSIFAWSRLTDQSTNLDIQPGLITFSAADISRNTSVQIRTLFPRSVFTDGSVALNEPRLTLENVLQEEEDYIQKMEEKAEKNAFYASITQPVTFVIILLSIGIFVFLYRKYGHRFNTYTISDRETIVIPDQTPPAIIGRLMASSMTTGHHITATLFDLARRGWFKIHEEEKKSTIFSSETTGFRISKSDPTPEDINSLPEWEKSIIRFVEKQVEKGNDTFDKLFKDSSSEVSKWYSSWTKMVKTAYEEQNWWDKNSYKGAAINMIVQLLLVGASIAMLILGTEIAIAGIILSGFMLFGSLAIIRKTKQGEETFRRWRAYIKGIKNADKRTLNMEKADLHFIYATAFGLSEKQITAIINQADDSFPAIFPWILFLNGSTKNPAALASTISTLSASGTTSFSGSVGGTGASMGAAGGGASSGAG